MSIFRRLISTLLLGIAVGIAHAEVMEDVTIRPAGKDAEIHIRFSIPIQLVRVINASSKDLSQAYYDIRPSSEAPVFVPGERRRVGGSGLPVVTVDDEPAQADEPRSLHRRLVISFDEPTDYVVRAGADNRTLLVTLVGLGHAVNTVMLSSVVLPSDKHYIISLQRSDTPEEGPSLPIPKQLQDYQVFTLRKVSGGRTRYEVAVGYFATIAEAEKVLHSLGQFPQAKIVSVVADTGANPRAEPSPQLPPSSAAAPMAAAPAPSGAAVITAQTAPTKPLVPNDDAAAVLAKANNAYEKGRLDEAKQLLNSILSLPPNTSSPDAQELLARVRLAQGDVVQARAEFESYLKQYPNAAGASRVRDTLSGLPAAGAAQPVVTAVPAAPKVTTTMNASVGQYYYGGQSSVQTVLERNADGTPLEGSQLGSVKDSTVSSTDQSQLQTNVDVNWRQRSADTDERFVFRDNYRNDFLDRENNKNRLSALYFDHRSLIDHWGVRLGRQSGLGDGVLGRFDGAYGSYGLKPKLKLTAVVGMPAEQLANSHRYFVGAGLDADALTPHLGGSMFVNQQMIDGEVDRRAVGGDLRYFTPHSSVFGSLDYDTIFRVLNVASVQGTYTLEDTTAINVLMDRRAATIATLGNNLFFQDPSNPGVQAQTIQELLQSKTLDQLHQLVKLNTAYTRQALASITTPVSKHWQTGLSVQFSRTGAIAPNPVLPTGQADTGNQYTYSAQFIGTNLYSSRDTHLFNVSFIRAPSFTGDLLTYNNLTVLSDAWQLEPSVRFQVNDDSSGHAKIYGPGLRVTYHPAKSWTLESNLSVELTRKTTPTGSENSNRINYYLGYRYDY